MADPQQLPPEAVTAVAEALGYRVTDPRLLRQAFTHASRCGAQASPARKRLEANERLEFLGDAVLGAAVAVLLFERLPDCDEGELSRRRSMLASRATLARALERAGLLPWCRVGAQMGDDSELWPDSVKANLAESLLAAVWCDGGWTALKGAVERLLGSFMDHPDVAREDSRMRLQALSLELHKCLPHYECQRAGGTDHAPEFEAQVTVGTKTGSGRGTSRRRAEAAAAECLLSQFDASEPTSTP